MNSTAKPPSAPMRRTLKAVGLLVGVFVGLLQAGDYGRIKGRVIDAETQQPIVGAAIEVDGTDYGATSEEDGSYLITVVPGGVQSITVSAVGYEPQRITDILVIVDQTVTQNVRMKSTVIQITKPIEAVAKRVITPTQTSTQRALTTAEFAKMPVASLAEIVSRQAGVVSHPTRGMHLRGGRPDEVAYYVDGGGTSDPLYGYQAARINPEATAEVVVITGGFDAEYGEAMSGVVQIITKEGKEKPSGRLRYTTDAFLPAGTNFGYNQLEASFGGGTKLGSSRLGYFISPELRLIGDYNPRKHRLPHQERNDYKLGGKLSYSLPVSAGMKFALSGFLSREQWDMQPYTNYSKNQQGFKYNLSHFLSERDRVRKADLAMDHLLTKDLFYSVRVGYFYDSRTRAVRNLAREQEVYGGKPSLFQDFIFKAEDSVMARDSVIYDLRRFYDEQRYNNALNPFGVLNMFYGIGDYRMFLTHWSTVITAKADLSYNLRKTHEFKTGFEARFNSLSRRYNSLPSDPNPFVDAYDYKPFNAAAYIQDRMDFDDLVIRAGLRLDYLDPNAYKKRDPASIEDTSRVAAATKYKFSPRLGVSFPISERMKFRFSYGHFFQTPAYHYLFDNITTAAYSRGNNIIGNPDLLAQQTVAYELGLETELSRVFSSDFTAYYKDIYDLIGTRYQSAVPIGYYPYRNEDYGSVRGFEIALTKALTDYWSSRVSYSLSLARGTASYSDEWYRERYNYGIDPVTGREMEPPKRDYFLDFDERHNVRADVSAEFPRDFSFAALRDFRATVMFSFGSGLPYSVKELRSGIDFDNGAIVGEKFSARMPARYSVDLRVSKGLRVGPLMLSLVCDVTNLLDTKNVEWVYGYTGRPDDDGYAETYGRLNGSGNVPITGGTYHPARDQDHDGYITPTEDYIAYKTAYRDFVNNPNNFGAPRQVRIGLNLEF